MLGKIKKRINTISAAGKISIVIGCVSGIILMAAAIYLSCITDLPLEYKYLREQMGQVSSTLFAVGVILGLIGDFLLAVVDRSGK